MEIGQIFEILRKRIAYFTITTLVVLGIFIIIIFRQPMQYQAQAKILVVSERKHPSEMMSSYSEKMPQLAEIMQIDTYRNIATQREILKSKPVIRRAEKISGIPRKQILEYRVVYVPDSDVIIISAISDKPDKTLKFVNSIATAYIDYLQTLRLSENKDARDFLNEQIELVGDDLKTTEQKLKDYKSATGIADLDQETNNMISTLVDFEADLENVKIELSAITTKIHKLQQQLSTEEREMISATIFSENPILVKMRSELEELETEYAKLSGTHAQKHPRIIEIETGIKRIKNAIQNETEKIISSQTKTLNPIHMELLSTATSLRAEEIALLSKKDALETTTRDMRTNLSQYPESEMKLANLTRDKLLKEKLFLTLAEKSQDFKISEKTRIFPAKILERAESAIEISSRKKIFSALIGLLVGLCFGLSAAFFAEYIDDAIYTTQDIKQYLDLKILALIPYDDSIPKKPLITHRRPNSPISESFRSLRNKLRYLLPELQGNTLLVTSSITEEGKSFIASNLAITVAQFEMKVLLIDCDLHRASLHKYFDVDNKGLLNVIVKNEPVDECITTTEIKGLSLMCSGPLPLLEISTCTSSEILESKRMKELFADLKKKFDIIIIDSPPVLPLTDTLTISTSADGILFVVDSGYVKREDALNAKSELELCPAPILGAILNKAEEKRGYYMYYYRYKYTNYAKRGDNSKTT
ncbi:MAG: polysaccharide biosynthesis tyrosine autokinase [bacterium]